MFLVPILTKQKNTLYMAFSETKIRYSQKTGKKFQKNVLQRTLVLGLPSSVYQQKYIFSDFLFYLY